MTVKGDLPISSCWVVSEGLTGLKNQAIGLAQALGLSYVLKEVKKPKGLWQMLAPADHGFEPPWPDVLISCGRQSVTASIAVRRASAGKTFTVHIQDPLCDPKHFDVVIVPEHDKLRGPNVFVTQGAVHHVTPEKLNAAAGHFQPLLASLPRPLISVLVGGKNRNQDFPSRYAQDLAAKLLTAAQSSGAGLAVSFSRRTGAENETILRQALSKVPSYIWDGQGENPYFGFLGLADALVVTSDSISMVSEACSTGKAVYIYELPGTGKRHKFFFESLVRQGVARPFLGAVESWKSTPLHETQKAADFIVECFCKKTPEGTKVCKP